MRISIACGNKKMHVCVYVYIHVCVCVCVCSCVCVACRNKQMQREDFTENDYATPPKNYYVASADNTPRFSLSQGSAV